MKEKLVPLRLVDRAVATIRRYGDAGHHAELSAAISLADKRMSRRRIVELARAVKSPRRPAST